MLAVLNVPMLLCRGTLVSSVKGISFKTASSSVLSEDGVRFKVGVWDADQDKMLMQKSPNLLSVGTRCLKSGMTFVWVSSCFPCFITADSQYIIILDVRDNLPIYSPAFEKLKDHFLGTFKLKDNCFQERCGIDVLLNGTVIISAKPVKDVVKRKQPSSGAMFVEQLGVDACTQTDMPTGVIFSGEASHDGLAEPSDIDDVGGHVPSDEILVEDDMIDEVVGGHVPSDDGIEVVEIVLDAPALEADVKRLLKD